MIIHIYLDAYYISELEARSITGGSFFPRTKIQLSNTSNAPENGPVNVEFRIIINGMATATKGELGGLLENCQRATSLQTALSEMGQS